MFAKLFGKKSDHSQKLEVPSKPTLPTVSFDPAWVTADIKKSLRILVSECNEVPEALHPLLYEEALKCCLAGGRLDPFVKGMQDSELSYLPKKVMRDIATHLWLATLCRINVARARQLGMNEAVWLYSGAPCNGSPHQNDMHRASNGRSFDLNSGLVVDGKQCWPGFERGCKCICRMKIKGFT